MSQQKRHFERPNIARMHGYTWGEQPDTPTVIKLNTNENPYPPSPAVAAALSDINVSALRTYPQATAEPLRRQIGQRHELSTHNIVLTNGGDEALRLALTTFVEPGSGFGMATPSYSLYPVLANIHDARIVTAELDEHWSPGSDFAARMNAEAVQLTCLVNPHAPSGTLLGIDTLKAIAETLDGVLLIDEAYVDFVDPELAYASKRLIEELDNVLVLRTFSKGYSLAGLRLGYLLGPATLIQPIVEKTRDSYNVDHISQVLGVAALGDRAYAQHTWECVRRDRHLLANHLGQLGLSVIPSESNFLLAEVSNDAKLSAPEVYTALKQRNILVRYFDQPRLADKLRITIGTPEQNDALLRNLTELLA